MQTLWSRAAQAQSSCRCRVCHHSANALVRRSTTTASRRKVTASDIFTACYTTILGTAAVLDAKRKNARRKELDAKLENARASLSSFAVQDAPSLPEDRGQETWATSADEARNHKGAMKMTETIDTAALLDELGQLATTTYVSRPRSSWLQSQIDWVHVEAAITAEEGNPDIFLRHPKNDQQMEKTTRMVEALVQQLLWQSQNHPGAPSHGVNGPTESFKDDRVLEEVEELNRSYPSYESHHADPMAATEARSLLSETFRRIFNKASSAKDAVGKICYNLLQSSAAPNIHNYNTLIAGFNRIQRPDLAQIVVDSYLDNVRWPATQQTMVCLLNHARGINNLEHFREIVARMRGTAGDGLHFRIFHRDAIYDEPGLRWAHKYAANRKHAYVERAPRGNEVFDSLIRGWLHFGKVDTAGMCFVACLRNGRLITIDTIYQLLTKCLATLNQQTARAMLDGLAKNFEKFERLTEYILAQSSTQTARKITDMFFALFDLCALPYKPMAGTVRKALSDVVEVFRNHHIVTQARLEVQEIAESSYSIIEQIGSSKPLTSKLDRALDLLSSIETNRLWDFKVDRGFRSLVAMAALVKRYQSLEERTKRIDVHVKVLIIKHVTGHDLDVAARLPPVDWQNRQWDEKCPASFYALQSIDLGLGPLTTNGLKAQLLAGLPDQDLAKKFEAFAAWGNLSFPSLISFYDPRQRQFVRNPRKLASLSLQKNRYVEEKALNIEETTKAILFCQLSGKKQKRLREFYRDWRGMPLTKLVEYNNQVLVHRLFERRSRTISQSYCKQDVGGLEVIVEALSRPASLWVDETTLPHTYAPRPAKPAIAVLPTLPIHSEQLWSGDRFAFTSL
ncbi:hypothetical protein BJ170DRAFT_677830 [Xylariales sp. AK1849]|nr:hypothetical protein BJ170DRAFT_677830 [Xylariales sp. AK1849]